MIKPVIVLGIIKENKGKQLMTKTVQREIMLSLRELN
jgi:hypothetical protein